VTPKQLARFKADLEALRAKTLAAGPARIEPNRTDETSVGVADEDAQALSEMLQAIGSQRNRGQAELVLRIDKALRKLGATPEEFGLCEDCEEPIARKRLEALPYAALCAACQEKRDPHRGPTRRKVTDFR
jgi:DnaK suppressor protein